MSTHDKYTELCALLAIGQLSASEDAELRAHLDNCPQCKAAARDYAQIVTREMPLSSSRFRQWWQAPRVHAAADMREQFLQHARSEGVRFSPEVIRRPSFMTTLGMPRLTRFYPGFVLLALVVVATVVGWSFRPERVNRSTNAGEATLTTEAALVREEALIKEVKDLKQANATLREEYSRSQEAKDSELRNLATMRSEALTKDQRINQLDQLLSSTQAKANALQASLKDATAKSSDFEARVNETARQLASARAEMENLRAARSDTEATLVGQLYQIKEMSEKLRVQTASLDMDRQLLAASRDVSNMMGARNLYITDVRDIDTRGNPKKAFGRIFYTEGKSLVFYAFDLADRKIENVRHSFQAWGHAEADPSIVKSLGIFFVDDKAQKRWVLKVDDPALLAHIDSVFVTVEPPGGEKRPTGQKLLYAFLNAPPNHP